MIPVKLLPKELHNHHQKHQVLDLLPRFGSIPKADGSVSSAAVTGFCGLWEKSVKLLNFQVPYTGFILELSNNMIFYFAYVTSAELSYPGNRVTDVYLFESPSLDVFPSPWLLIHVEKNLSCFNAIIFCVSK